MTEIDCLDPFLNIAIVPFSTLHQLHRHKTQQITGVRDGVSGVCADGVSGVCVDSASEVCADSVSRVCADSVIVLIV